MNIFLGKKQEITLLKQKIIFYSNDEKQLVDETFKFVIFTAAAE